MNRMKALETASVIFSVLFLNVNMIQRSRVFFLIATLKRHSVFNKVLADYHSVRRER